ncbi:MAG: hypothetical protein IKL73_02080 [Lachnospiraceae bacterium]|nr:hypothetical protein [Lachnospira sp.]MBR6697039.1 hypothetical protein [Lachnospiraceae bacterium]
MNPAMIFQMKKHWETFVANHPKFPLFLRAAKDNGISVGSIIDVTITTADGKSISTNVKLTESDMQLFEAIKGMM